MTKLTSKELIELLETEFSNLEDNEDVELDYNSWHDAIGHEPKNAFDQLFEINPELKETIGEIEFKIINERSMFGDHDSSETVIYFKEHDLYLEVSGYYSSMNGCDYDEINEVFPETFTTIIYNRK